MPVDSSIDALSEGAQAIVGLLGIALSIFLVWFFSKRSRENQPSNLSERGRLLLEERIPLVRHLSDADKAKLFQSVSALRKAGGFQARVPTTANGYAFIDIKLDDQAMLFGLMAFTMLYRSAPVPEHVFPLVLTDDTVVSTDPIYLGAFKKGQMRFISRSDLDLDYPVHALGISPLVFQFAKCLDEPDLKQAKPEHRAEFLAFMDTLNSAYERIVMAPARAHHEETGEALDILSGIGFLLESQKMYFGSLDEFNNLDSDVKGALAILYGERRILN
ncbi:MAG: hypothetical protein ACK4M6_04685 [Hyphomonas sp.]